MNEKKKKNPNQPAAQPGSSNLIVSKPICISIAFKHISHEHINTLYAHANKHINKRDRWKGGWGGIWDDINFTQESGLSHIYWKYTEKLNIFCILHLTHTELKYLSVQYLVAMPTTTTTEKLGEEKKKKSLTPLQRERGWEEVGWGGCLPKMLIWLWQSALGSGSGGPDSALTG